MADPTNPRDIAAKALHESLCFCDEMGGRDCSESSKVWLRAADAVLSALLASGGAALRVHLGLPE